MKHKRFAATALMAIAATGIAAGTGYAASAEPAPIEQVQPAKPQFQGQEQGVDYKVTMAEIGNQIITEVTGGRFGLDAATKTVALRNTAGDTVFQVPLVGEWEGKPYELAAAVDNDGGKLTLSPVSAPAGTIKDISSQEWFMAELQRASLGALIGGIIGFFVLGVGAIPGAIIGLLIAGGQPLIASGSAYFSGQP
ncbi:DUF456 domain-containing protein [Nocardia crassostreae]|uniref:DUF456 domain-containing protein n=1 Tax=Nocardia crassostreae TaxID=53428 RepID=UPI00083103D2|nr:DUF456 domain-containing protein [Nocardia crassostreae]